MPVLDQLEPRGVFRFFEQICAIPHGSRNTKAISDWCAAFARERGFPCWQDGANNIVIKAPAAPGYEGAPPMILQGHLDMVCEKEPDCPLDMDREGLDLLIEDGYVRARGTTLGGDDGIAVAMALAILDDPSLPRPALEVLLTTEEEIGMLGASALDPALLDGRQLLNLDSEDEGVFTVSCAGGATAQCTLPVVRETPPPENVWTRLVITLSGLTGGHSGAEIHLGRASANKLLGEALAALSARQSLRLVRVRGGRKDNAIPVSAEAEIVVPNGERETMHTLFEIVTNLRERFAATDPGFAADVTEAGTVEPGTERAEAPLLPMDEASTARIIRFLGEAPFGVQAWSRDIEGLVQTSLNLGILDTGREAVTAAFSVRSSAALEKLALLERLKALSGSCGGSMRVEGEYPAWEYRADSQLRTRCQEAFRDLYGYDAKVSAIHAGLECGILCGKLPGLDCVSLGPNLPDIHTPRERMEIASVQRTWALALEILRRSK